MPGASTSRFHTTSWTLVVAAADGQSTTHSRLALESLCQTYWRPVYSFIRRSSGDKDQAQDLTQGFFALMLEKKYLQDADRARGKFRSFLLTAVKHFLANEFDRAHALKRGGGKIPISIDPADAEGSYAAEAAEQDTPESLFERRWALSILEQVMAKLRAEFAGAGKSDHFDQLAGFLSGSAETPYEALAVEMGISPGALRVAVHRMRRRYRDLLRAEIGETVSKPGEIDEEIRFLLSTLSAS